MKRLLTLLMLTSCQAPSPVNTLDTSPDLVILESDYTTGLISGWTSNFEAQLGTLPSNGDAKIVALSTGYALLERSQTDAVTFLDHQLNIIHQVALPERSNPHDLIETQDTYWISLYQNPKIIRLDKQSYEPITAIDGESWTDADGRPEASDLYVHSDGTIFLTVQNLDFTGVEPIPPTTSQLIHLQANGELIDRYAIPSNPFAPVVAYDDDHLLIACNYGWEIEENAGLWRFNIRDQAQELLVNESQLNGNILNFITHEDFVYILVSQLDFSTALYRFNPSTKALITITGSTSSLGCLTRSQKNTIYVCDRQIGNHGIRQLDSGSQQLKNSLFTTTLAPLQILTQ
jgi:hypothetical protein